MKQKAADPSPDLAPEINFSGAIRGKHHAALAQGTNVVLLDSDVAEVFKDSAAVNEALRLLLRFAREQSHIKPSA